MGKPLSAWADAIAPADNSRPHPARVVLATAFVLGAAISVALSMPPGMALVTYVSVGVVGGLFLVQRALPLRALGFVLYFVTAQILARRVDPASSNLWWQPYVITGAAMLLPFLLAVLIRSAKERFAPGTRGDA
jgi:hypothetical protein